MLAVLAEVQMYYQNLPHFPIENREITLISWFNEHFLAFAMKQVNKFKKI